PGRVRGPDAVRAQFPIAPYTVARFRRCTRVTEVLHQLSRRSVSVVCSSVNRRPDFLAVRTLTPRTVAEIKTSLARGSLAETTRRVPPTPARRQRAHVDRRGYFLSLLA